MGARKKTKSSKKSSRSNGHRPTQGRNPPKLRQKEMRTDPAIDEYLAGVSPSVRNLLQQVRKIVHVLVPEVEECISYRIPAFRYDGRIIAGFSATSTGCSYYPFSGTTLDIEGYNKTKSALHFDEPLPTALVRKLLKARISEGMRRTPRRTA
jgi:uncharacterized protein YdhG (YjbR/CyaY superfamily)